MKAVNQQMAFLLDEFGGFSGLVTMEDLVEEIVGNINDEFDDESDIVKQDENSYIVNGTVAIHELNTELDLELDDSNVKYDTVAGLIVYSIGHIPHKDENIDIVVDNIRLKVIKQTNNRIIKVLITKLCNDDDSTDEID